MTAEGCREWRERLGAYVLGQLPDDEHAATAAHIEGCAACRAEAESLAPLAELLPKADPAQLGRAPAPPAELGERIASRVARERRTRGRRRRTRLTLGFATAAAAAAAAVLAIAIVDSSPPPRGDSQVVTFRSVPRGVQVSARLEPRPFGTEIHMYVRGMPSGTLCRVSLRRADGTAMPAGTFRYRYGEPRGAVLTSALDLSGARAIAVRAGGRTFVAPLSKRGSSARGAASSSNWTTTKPRT
jgi:hypothetical protein